MASRERLQTLFAKCQSAEQVALLHDQFQQYDSAFDLAEKRYAQLRAASHSSEQLPVAQHGGNTSESGDDDQPLDLAAVLQQSPSEWYSLDYNRRLHSKKFRIWSDDLTVQIKTLPFAGLASVLPLLFKLFEHLFLQIAKDAPPKSLIRVVLQSNQLREPISLETVPKEKLNAEMFFTVLSNVLQSYQKFSLREPIIVNVLKIQPPKKAGGPVRRKDVLLEDYCRNKRCFISVPADGLCAARALVLGKHLADGKADERDKKFWRALCTNNKGKINLLQTTLATDLHRSAGIPIGPVSLDQMEKFQNVLQAYQITIFNQAKPEAIAFQGRDSPQKINLYLANNHYTTIRTLSAFFEKRGQCPHCGHYCRTGHSYHICPMLCRNCERPKNLCVWFDNGSLSCLHCHKTFPNAECFGLHKTIKNAKQRSICERFHLCRLCSTFYQVDTKREELKHVCHERYCKNCKMIVPSSHSCYITPYDLPPAPLARFIYADFESSIVDKNRHTAICAVAMYGESGETFSFFGKDTQETFCKWLFQRDHMGFIVVFHNLAGYDCSFILDFLHQQRIRPNLILRGLKVLQIRIEELKMSVKDSLAFLPMSVANMPRSFGFEESDSKLYFPHLFSKEENFEYSGSLPAKSFFLTHTMKTKELCVFEKWHAERSADATPWQFFPQLLAYCIVDVRILLRACTLFSQSMRDLTSFDPMTECITLASFVNLILRAKFLKPHTIQLLPKEVSKTSQNISAESLEWLFYMEHVYAKDIHTGRNSLAEKSIGRFRVDGFIEDENTALDYHGCYFHGCQKCFRPEQRNFQGNLMADLFRRTSEKRKFMKAQGIEYIEMWSCTWRIMREDPVVQEILSQYRPRRRLNPRDCLAGGRTECFNVLKLIPREQRAAARQHISYKDITSLYPYICKGSPQRPFPIGTPIITVKNFRPLDEYFGIALVSVLPPAGLRLPVLQVKLNSGRAVYALCNVCAEDENQGRCPHSDKQRTITGTFTTEELKLALRKGYLLQKIHEIWHYPQRSETLFSDFVNAFYGLKIKNSGFPSDCDTDDKKEAYVKFINLHEGLDLKMNDISLNPTQRLLSKCMLNSMWGRLALRNNQPKFEYVQTSARLDELLFSGIYSVQYINVLDEDTLQVQYSMVDETDAQDLKSNIIVASFVTSYARIVLYEAMDIVGAERLCYCDTDSIVAVEQEGLPTIPLGPLLGQFTSELNHDDEIVTWGCIGAKCYFAHTKKGETIVRAKGITITNENEKLFDFENFERMAKDHDTVFQTLNPFKIFRTKGTWDLRTGPQSKSFRYTFNKRQLLDNFETQPYGFVREDEKL